MGNNPVSGVDSDGRWSDDPDEVVITAFPRFNLRDYMLNKTSKPFSANNARMTASKAGSEGWIHAAISLRADLKLAEVNRLKAFQKADWLNRGYLWGNVDDISLFDPKLLKKSNLLKGVSRWCFYLGAVEPFGNIGLATITGEYENAYKPAMDIGIGYGAWKIGGFYGFALYGFYQLITIQVPEGFTPPKHDMSGKPFSTPPFSTYINSPKPVFISKPINSYTPQQFYFNQR